MFYGMMLSAIAGAVWLPWALYVQETVLPEQDMTFWETLMVICFGVFFGAGCGAVVAAVILGTLYVLVYMFLPEPNTSLRRPSLAGQFWRQKVYWIRTVYMGTLWSIAGLVAWPTVLSEQAARSVLFWLLTVEVAAAASGVLVGAIGWAIYPDGILKSVRSHVRSAGLGAMVTAAVVGLVVGTMTSSGVPGVCMAALGAAYGGFLLAFLSFALTDSGAPPFKEILNGILQAVADRGR
jgi:hypothetical protein